MRRLLIRPGAIGDCILTLRAMERYRDGASHLEVWAPSVVLPLIRFADATRSIAASGLDLVGITESHAMPALEQFDEIISWYGAARDDFRKAVAHLPFQFFPALPPPPGVPRIDVPRVARTRVIVHPFSGGATKNWPLAHYRRLARELNAEWAVDADGRARFDNLYELAAWLASATVYIGNDSGVTHLASAVGTPVVALFGPTDPAIWRPRGERVRVIRRMPMEDIPVDEVLDAARAIASRDGGLEDDDARGGSQSLRAD